MSTTDADLLAYLDGEGGEEHIEADDKDRARLAELSELQNRLTARLHRFECPPPDILGDYYLNLLAPSQKLLIHAHVGNCLRCRDELGQLAQFMQPEAGLVERLKTVIASLLPAPSASSAAAGLRGSESDVLLYEAEGLQITLNFEDDGSQAGRRVMMGYVSAPQPLEFSVMLWQDRDLLHRLSLDELGNFVLGGLEPGTYDMVLRGPDLEILIQSLKI